MTDETYWQAIEAFKTFDPDLQPPQTATKEGDDWVGHCDHGREGVWTIHRRTEYNAWRSLRAHAKECPARGGDHV